MVEIVSAGGIDSEEDAISLEAPQAQFSNGKCKVTILIV